MEDRNLAKGTKGTPTIAAHAITSRSVRPSACSTLIRRTLATTALATIWITAIPSGAYVNLHENPHQLSVVFSHAAPTRSADDFGSSPLRMAKQSISVQPSLHSHGIDAESHPGSSFSIQSGADLNAISPPSNETSDAKSISDLSNMRAASARHVDATFSQASVLKPNVLSVTEKLDAGAAALEMARISVSAEPALFQVDWPGLETQSVGREIRESSPIFGEVEASAIFRSHSSVVSRSSKAAGEMRSGSAMLDVASTALATTANQEANLEKTTDRLAEFYSGRITYSSTDPGDRDFAQIIETDAYATQDNTTSSFSDIDPSSAPEEPLDIAKRLKMISVENAGSFRKGLAKPVLASKETVDRSFIVSSSAQMTDKAPIAERIVARVNGASSGSVDLLNDNGVLKVKLGSILDLTSEQMARGDYERLSSSSAANEFISLETLNENGLAIDYDPVYDEIRLGQKTSYDSPQFESHIDQVTPLDSGPSRTMMEQIE